MLELSDIKETVIQVAEAITAAIGIETEIVDAHLRIIGGTGRYVKKIGSYEENGDLDSPYFYAKILREGVTYVSTNAQNDPIYQPVEEELAEISCPIKVDDLTIGIIGLVAFDKEQQSKIEDKTDSYLYFLKKMSELIASKLIESQSNLKLARMMESMPDGLLAVDKDGIIFSINNTAVELLGRSKDKLLSTDIKTLFNNPAFFANDRITNRSMEKEIEYKLKGKTISFYFTKILIPDVGILYLFEDARMMAKNMKRLVSSDEETGFDDIYGVSKSLQDTKHRALSVAESNSTVLITGESGTGKELFARAIHFSSLRKSNIFLSINCGAIPDTLLESELFGYTEGAFTGANKSGKPGKFELANGGTIFLDEIGDMPLHLQVKLLHVLQNKVIERIGGVSKINIDVRVIAATNKDLDEMIRKNEFREDLYFRLNVIPLDIPPLRERREDIEPLLNHSLKKFNDILHKNIKGFSESAVKILLEYSWPGNIRELENSIEYSVNLEKDDYIQVGNLPDRIKTNYHDNEMIAGTLKEQTDLFHRQLLIKSLARTGKSLEGKREAAKTLGISESTLYRRLRELDLL